MYRSIDEVRHEYRFCSRPAAAAQADDVDQAKEGGGRVEEKDAQRSSHNSFKGVTAANNGKWRARLEDGPGRKKKVAVGGLFATAEDAARAWRVLRLVASRMLQ